MSVSPNTTSAPDPRVQWLNARLIVRSELKFDTRSIGNETQIVIEDPVRSKFFQIGTTEYQLIATLDGKRSIAEILASMNDVDSGTEQELPGGSSGKIDEARAIQIAQWLVQNNLAFGHGVDNSKRLDQQSRQIQRGKVMGWLNPISCKIKLFNPNRWLTVIQPYTQWMFSSWVLLVWLAVGGYAMTILFTDWHKMGDASTGIFSGTSWIWLLIIWLGLKIVHETAHGIACRRFGGEVPEAGVLLLLFTPMAYVNVTSMWRFSNRWERIAVSSAGMYVELFVSFIALILWQRFPGVVGDVAFKVFMMASVTTILFNANPLMRFDGYFILSDLLNIPNLYTKGTKWFGDRFKHVYFGIPKTPNLYAPTERRYVQVYGVLASLWKWTISISLIIGASVLFHGAGLLLAAIGAVLWYGMPAWQHFRTLQGAYRNRLINNQRLTISCCTTALLMVGMFVVLKAPATKSAPAIVQFSDEQILRAGSDGFVRTVLVENRAAVLQGQSLLVLDNPQLELELSDLKHLANEANIEARISRNNGHLAMAQAATERHDGLLKQLAEKQAQIEQLTIRAPFDGFVFQRGLENRIGSFAHQGDSLLSLAKAETKEVVVAVDQRDLESMHSQHGKFLRVAFPGQKTFQSKFTHINPRASTVPHHVALGANVGGPLPVRPTRSNAKNSESGFELLTPRFTIELELEPAAGAQLFAGQRGRAFFATSRQSLGSYLYLAVSDWLKHKLDMATQSAAF